DLMVVCLESGLGLNSTIARVGEERATMNDPLGNEFSVLALELREGRSREEALRAFGGRNGVEDLKALSALIIQSDRLGASMSKTLRADEEPRARRRALAEAVPPGAHDRHALRGGPRLPRRRQPGGAHDRRPGTRQAVTTGRRGEQRPRAAARHARQDRTDRRERGRDRG